LIQIIDCDPSLYLTLQLQFNLTIQHALSACTDGVAPTDVTKITLTAVLGVGVHSHTGLLRGPGAYDAPAQSKLRYTVTSNDPDMTYAELKAQIEEAAATGVLTDNIHHYADVYGAPALRNVTVGEPTVSNAAQSDSSDSSDLNGGEIAGIVIGCVLFVTLCVLIIGFSIHHRNVKYHAANQSPGSDAALNRTETPADNQIEFNDHADPAPTPAADAAAAAAPASPPAPVTLYEDQPPPLVEV
jgi:hypothetical protein